MAWLGSFPDQSSDRWAIRSGRSVLSLPLPMFAHIFLHTHTHCTRRFDRGPTANCAQFWMEPSQDWWQLFAQGDEVGTRACSCSRLHEHACTHVQERLIWVHGVKVRVKVQSTAAEAMN